MEEWLNWQHIYQLSRWPVWGWELVTRGAKELGTKPFVVGLFAAALVGVIALLLVLAPRPTLTF